MANYYLTNKAVEVRQEVKLQSAFCFQEERYHQLDKK